MATIPMLTNLISLEDLYVAYRKAKAEAFYERTHFSALAFSEFEEKLPSRLRELHERLTETTPSWHQDSSYLGGFSYAPKSNDGFAADQRSLFFRSLDPIEEWTHRFTQRNNQRCDVSFRLIAVPTVEFHIICALWIMKVGHKFEAALDANVCYAHRLRRKRGQINKECLGLFTPYAHGYQAWRSKGLTAVNVGLASGKRVAAVTMDLQRYYHQASPKFLLRPAYLKMAGIALTGIEHNFTQHFLSALDTWYRHTPDCKSPSDSAIPVGLSASKIIANALLVELDREIVKRLKPRYYGRYVDDIFIVLDLPKKAASGRQVMRHIAQRIPRLLKLGQGKSPSIRLKLPYSRDSRLIFTGEKQKVFDLYGKHGRDLVTQIEHRIGRQASEHRLFPVLPERSEEMAARALLAESDASLDADALRKSDALSVRRNGLALLLRDMESYSLDLPPSEWADTRSQFYGLIERHVLTPVGYFSYFQYVYRVMGLMVAANDFGPALDLLKRARKIFRLLERTTTAGTSEKKKFAYCKEYFAQGLMQAALQAVTSKSFIWEPAFRSVMKEVGALGGVKTPVSARAVKSIGNRLFYSDLARRPYREAWLADAAMARTNPRPPKLFNIRRRLVFLRALCREAGIRLPYWPGVVFAVRPPTLAEITAYATNWLYDQSKLRKAVMELRGAEVNPDLDLEVDNVDEEIGPSARWTVPQRASGRYIFAIPSYLTTLDEWNSAVDGTPAHTKARYKRLRTLLNSMLSTWPRPDYVVFPELSIPRLWAMGIASKLARESGVSLIAGVEYKRVKSGLLRNDALISLTTGWGYGRGNAVYIQSKEAPAHEEAKRLNARGRRALYIPSKRERSNLVIHHNKLCFSVQICSDLTNISRRSQIRGEIDALVVLAWNQDTTTFSALVEASAYDLHAYVVLVNNSEYGDSRIRVPASEGFKRDVVRVKGGMMDYFVMANLDVRELRVYQATGGGAGDGPYKPVPIGYRMSKYRRMLLGE